MWNHIKRWYKGKVTVHHFDNDKNSTVTIFPLIRVDYHWTAKIARYLVAFYLRHWQWILSTFIACGGLFVAYLRLK